jgi:hypothetical protein
VQTAGELSDLHHMQWRSQKLSKTGANLWHARKSLGYFDESLGSAKKS